MKNYPHKARTAVGFVLYLLSLGLAFAVIHYTDFNREARAVAAGLAFLTAVAFCVGYHRRTKGHWRDTVLGVHLMAFSISMAAFLLYLVLALLSVLPDWLAPYASAWIYVTVAFLFLWRHSLMRDGQRKPVDRAAA